jgi:hypothetical protein
MPISNFLSTSLNQSSTLYAMNEELFPPFMVLYFQDDFGADLKHNPWDYDFDFNYMDRVPDNFIRTVLLFWGIPEHTNVFNVYMRVA